MDLNKMLRMMLAPEADITETAVMFPFSAKAHPAKAKFFGALPRIHRDVREYKGKNIPHVSVAALKCWEELAPRLREHFTEQNKAFAGSVEGSAFNPEEDGNGN